MPAEQRPALERPRPSSRADDVTLTTLYEEHRAEIFAFLVRMIRDRETAEDILQETFIRLIKEARAGRMPETVRAWLYRVAANEAISRSRRTAVWRRLVPRLLERNDPERPDEEALQIERQSEPHVALGKLEPNARAALLMGAQGFSGAEIARSIGRSEAATRTLMCRSRVQLRLLLAAAEGER